MIEVKLYQPSEIDNAEFNVYVKNAICVLDLHTLPSL